MFTNQALFVDIREGEREIKSYLKLLEKYHPDRKKKLEFSPNRHEVRIEIRTWIQPDHTIDQGRGIAQLRYKGLLKEEGEGRDGVEALEDLVVRMSQKQKPQVSSSGD
jgi:hypothetical protein